MTIKEGRYYLDRKGRVHGPVVRRADRTEDDAYPFLSSPNGLFAAISGRYWFDGEKHDRDLITECDKDGNPITEMEKTEYIWGKDWLIALTVKNKTEYSGLRLYRSKGGNNTSTTVLNITGTDDEITEIYEYLLFGAGTSQDPEPGSLMSGEAK